MDDTKLYMKMSEKAEEVQRYFYEEYKKSNFHYSYIDWLSLTKTFYYIAWKKEGLSKIVILSRQDQLQEMIKDKFKNNLDMFVAFYGFITHDEPLGFDGLFSASYESLWFTFVMKEKYNKIWDGENWVKEK